ncbi:hypothetical protein [Frigidibacter sp. ROC022]|uniref:hypothetical protein n=1 Tax=Frigidibacter sp. ROC022 TaxID=2971796 RepID=UPI00215A10EA|nr:hypothetical protein [Frigidibacter sp. ROC022]MCR8724920.1 hypothetical protein [Frigidibacter sp. ROC022]
MLRAAPPGRSAHRTQFTFTEVLAAVLSLAWMAGVTLVIVFSRSDQGLGQIDTLRFVVTLMAVFLPVAVIWVGASAARSSRVMREESQRLQASIDAIRHSYLSQVQGAGPVVRPTFERKLDEIAQAQKKTEAAIATFASIRSPGLNESRRPVSLPPPPAAPADQQSLELGGPSEPTSQPPSTEDFIQALNFPENAEDADGFRALRRALQDRQTAQLIQASQDVLTLLSQDGIYMDDLKPERAKPDVWRRFAQGERGRTISALGGIRDRSGLALASGRMRSDTIFRDAVHHFLRKFDQMLAGFEKNASDAEIAALADTRTARAFMLLGRVTGTFD